MDYGIGVKNRYAFLEDDVEDIVPDVVAASMVRDLKKTTGTVKEQQARQNEANVEVEKGDHEPEVVMKSTGAVRGGRGHGVVDRTGRGDNNVRTLSENERDKENNYGSVEFGPGEKDGERGPVSVNQEVDDWDYMPKPNKSREESRGRGFRVFSRGGLTRSTRRREFDRISGSSRSGIKALDKRDGTGSYNWGTYKDQIQDDIEHEMKIVPYETEHAGGQGDANMIVVSSSDQLCENNGQVTGVENGKSVVVNEEPKTITLGQWKAMQQPRTTPNFNIRKPNEGEDPTKWKNLVLKKKEDVNDVEELVYDEAWVPQRAGRQKVITDIGFRFDDREERSYRRGFKNQQQGQSVDGIVGDAGASSDQGKGVGYISRGRGIGRGFRRDRQTEGKSTQRNPPRVDDVKEWPSLIC